jgi:hypothetical protein
MKETGQLEAVSEPMDTSKGNLQLAPHHRLMYLGLLGVPFSVWAVLFAASLVTILAKNVLTAATAVVLLLAAAALAVSSAALLRLRTKTKLITKVAAHRKDLRARRSKQFKPADPGPFRALAAGQFQEFYDMYQEFIRDRNMYYIEPNIVRPLTEIDKISYSDFAGSKEVMFFISHFWGMAFRNTLQSMRQHAEGAAKSIQQENQPDEPEEVRPVAAFLPMTLGRLRQAGQSREVQPSLPDTPARSSAWKSINYWFCTFSNNQWDLPQASLICF